MNLADVLVPPNPGPTAAKVVALTNTFEAIRANIRKAASSPQPGSHPFVDHRSPGFHASSFYDQCGRQVALSKRLRVPQWNVIEERGWPHLLLGTLLHTLWQDSYLGPAGVLLGGWTCVKCRRARLAHDHRVEVPEGSALYFGTYPGVAEPCLGCGAVKWTYDEIGVRIKVEGVPDEPEWHIVGHCDGLLISDVVIDLKSIYEGGADLLADNWASIDKPIDWIVPDGTLHWSKSGVRKYYMQLQLYLAALGKQTGLFIYLPKDKLHDPYAAVGVRILRDPRVEEAAKAKVRAIYRAVHEDGPMPARVCATPTDQKARGCAVCNECFAGAP